MFDVLKLPMNISQSIQNKLKSVVSPNEAATIFQGKVKTCHHRLKVSNVAVYMSPVLNYSKQRMKVSLMTN